MWPFKKLVVYVLLIGHLPAHAQSLIQRVSVNAGIGNSYNLEAHQNKLSMNWSSRITFTPIHLLLLEAEYNRGELNGEHNGITPGSTVEEPYFSTYQYSGFLVNLNVLKLVTPKKPLNNYALYLFAGYGYLNFESVLHPNNNPNSNLRYTYKVYTNALGIRGRYKLHPSLDLLATLEGRFPQTYFLDANPEENRYDRFLNVKIELCYKLSSVFKKEYIEWIKRPRKINCPD